MKVENLCNHVLQPTLVDVIQEGIPKLNCRRNDKLRSFTKSIDSFRTVMHLK